MAWESDREIRKLLTLKAVRLIRENEVIALPGEGPEGDCGLQDFGAGRAGACGTRHCMALTMPMTKDTKDSEGKL